MFYRENNIMEKYLLDRTITFKLFFVEQISNAAAAKIPNHGSYLST